MADEEYKNPLRGR